MTMLATCVRSLALALAVSLPCGCTTLQVKVHLDQLAASGVPLINALVLTGQPGRYELHSGVRAQGPITDSADWVRMNINPSLQRLHVRFEASAKDAEAIQSTLEKARETCEPTKALVEHNLELAEKRLLEWMPSWQWPEVRIRLVADGSGMRMQELSQARTIDGLTLYLGRPALYTDNCSVQAMLASDIAEMMIHELTHIANAQKFGKKIDSLTNEYIAYATQLCLRLEINGRLPFPMVTIPGVELDHENLLKDERFWTLVESGTMGHSLAGLLLADSMRSVPFGPRPLNTGDILAMNEICAKLHRLPALSVRSRQMGPPYER